MEWNTEYTQLQLTCVAGTVQSSLSYLLSLQGTYLTVEAVKAGPATSSIMSRSENVASLNLDPSAATKQVLTSYSTMHGGHAY